MKTDWLNGSLRSIQSVDEGVDEALESKALLFLRACGTLSRTDWELLNASGQAAFAAAADALRKEAAILLADTFLERLEPTREETADDLMAAGKRAVAK